MTRDLNLIEKILTLVKNNQEEHVPQIELVDGCGEDYTVIEVHHHLLLCLDAGFIATDGSGLACRLTWKGHLATESPHTMIYGAS